MLVPGKKAVAEAVADATEVEFVATLLLLEERQDAKAVGVGASERPGLVSDSLAELGQNSPS